MALMEGARILQGSNPLCPHAWTSTSVQPCCQSQSPCVNESSATCQDPGDVLTKLVHCSVGEDPES